MTSLSPSEQVVAELIIEALNLEDISVADIEPDAALFGEGLGLDSIDALEIALAISQQFGFQLKSDDPGNTDIFSSLRALTAHIEKNKTT